MTTDQDIKPKPGWLQKLRSKSLQIQPGDSKLVRVTKDSGFYLFLIFMSLITVTIVTAVVAVL